MTNPTSNFGWQMPTSTDLVTDLPADFEVFGQAVDTSLADLKGGTTGQVLSKASNTNMDFTWVTTDDANAIQNSIVDAKGDLVAASANDTPARLAVGNNGETLVADSSTSTGLRYTAGNPIPNPVINSCMDIAQRGTAFSLAAGNNVFTLDRWKSYTVNAAITVSRQATSDTTNLPFIQYCARVQRNSGQTATGQFYYGNSFETINSIPFVGKAVTFSFYARAGANYSPTSSALTANLYSGTGTDQNWMDVAYTGQATVAGGTATLTTTWQRFTFTGTVATTATELAIVFNASGTGTAGTSDYFEVTGVQIDIGSVALPVRRNGATIQGELDACQRYFRSLGYGLMGACISATTVQLAIYHPSMRVTPTFAAPSPIQISDMISTSFTQSSTSISIIVATQEGSWLSLPNFTGMTTGRPATLNSPTGISLSAEL